jgi:hypothetical protein
MRDWPAIMAFAFALGAVLSAGASNGRPRLGRTRDAAAAARPPAAAKAARTTTERGRDPFLPLVSQKANDLPLNLPPGKAGLIIGRLRLEGLVAAPGGRIAVVSTPHGRVFFLHSGDRLYDGSLEAVDSASARFREVTRDAYGRPLARTVTLRLYSGGRE